MIIIVIICEKDRYFRKRRDKKTMFFTKRSEKNGWDRKLKPFAITLTTAMITRGFAKCGGDSILSATNSAENTKKSYFKLITEMRPETIKDDCGVENLRLKRGPERFSSQTRMFL